MGALRNAGVERDGIGQVGARHEVGYQRHARRIEHDVERRGERRGGENMPDLNQLGEGQDTQGHGDKKIAKSRNQENLFAIKKVRQGAAK